MLGKLIKYELKGTAHYFLPLFAATVVLSMLIRLFGGAIVQSTPLISGLLIFIEVVLIIALAVMTLVITIQRFYKNLLGNEGYLMFTLPVSTHHNIWGKLLVATLWNIAAGLVIALSVLIMVWQVDFAEFFAPLWRELSSMLSIENPLLLIFEWIVVGLIGVAGNILLLYLAMAIGQLANAHKFLASFGAFIALQCAMGAITAILTGIIAILPIQPLLAWLEQQGPIVILHLGTLVAALTAIVSGAVYYFFTHWLLKRKLNLT